MTIEGSAPGYVPDSGTLISLAWKTAVVALRAMPALFGSAVFLCLLVDSTDLVIDNGTLFLTNHLGRDGATALIWLWGAASFLLEASVLAPVAVAVHRLVLLRQTTPGLIAWNHRRIWRFIGWALLLELAKVFVMLPVQMVPEGAKPFAIAAIAVPMIIVSVRSLLIFPDVAVETPTANLKERFARSWNSTRRHFWRLALALLGTILLLYLPLLVTDAIATFFFVLSEDSIQTYSAIHIGAKLIDAALAPIDIALGAAVASWFYMWLHQNCHGVVPELRN